MDLKSEPLREVLEKYPYTVKGIRTESYKQKKGVWWVETTTGMRILKKHPNSEPLLQYLISATMHLQRKGMHIPRINETKDGSLYAKIGDACFLLIDAVDGVNPDYRKPEELNAIVRELGRFHLASEGFLPTGDLKVRQHLGTWRQDFSSDVSRLTEFFNEEKNKTNHSEFGERIIEVFPSFLKRMEVAINGLGGPEYASWVNKTAAIGGLCHQDFAAGNILLNSDGKVYILDTDSLTIDLPARDIRKLLNKVMKKNGKWEAALLENILRGYQQANPLTIDEWAVLKLDLTFPHLFAGIMDKYYRQREKDWTESKYLSRLKEMIVIERSLEEVLKKYDAVIMNILQ